MSTIRHFFEKNSIVIVSTLLVIFLWITLFFLNNKWELERKVTELQNCNRELSKEDNSMYISNQVMKTEMEKMYIKLLEAQFQRDSLNLELMDCLYFKNHSND